MCLRVAPGRRFELAADSVALLFARVDDGWWTLNLLLAEPRARCDVLPAIRAETARKVGPDLPRWAHLMSEQLCGGGVSPLHAGGWTMHDIAWPAITPRTGAGLGWLRADLVRYESDGTATFDYESSSEGSAGMPLIPTRHLSEPDEPRVKSMRRLVREGVLPPVLLWSVTGFVGYVILDGHDRLVAAMAEDAMPSFIVVSRTDRAQSLLREQAATARYEATMQHLDLAARRGGDPDGVTRARTEASRELARRLGLRAQDPTWSWPIDGGAPAWSSAASQVSAQWVHRTRWDDDR
jgi:hypothetical protein